MVKRGKISFSGGQRIFRFSAPGVPLDTATAGQLLLDEAILYPQVVQSFFVPYSASPSGVATPLIDIGQTPFIEIFPQDAVSGELFHPCQRYFASAYATAMSTRVWFNVMPTQLIIYFSTTATLAGVRVVTMRRATG